MHEEWTDRLSDYLDGELAADEERALESHLRECAPCAAVLNDLKRVVARAQAAGATARPPHADLWAGIAERIEAERTWAVGAGPADNVTSFRGRAPPHRLHAAAARGGGDGRRRGVGRPGVAGGPTVGQA